MNRQGRPTEPVAAVPTAPNTFTGNRALRIEEALIFEIGRPEVTGVDLDEPAEFTPRLGGLERKAPIGLPGLAEPEAVRHYVRLSRMNYGIDTGVFPLGSCTMKHNPRLNEKMARLPGFGDIHPLQPQSTVPGALELIAELSRWLCELTGMPAVALTPKAGAHGELCGMMAIKAALAARGEKRSIVLVPESAHGTNPATAALLGYRVEVHPGAAGRHGRSRGGEEASLEGRRRHHADQPEHLRAVRARRRGDRRRGACGRRVLLCRRRELQRHRRQGAAGRSRRRRDAHQPAQDVLDAAWRRRAGRRAGGAVGRARAVRAAALRRRPTRTASRLVEHAERRRRQAVRPHVRVPRPDGHVRARDELHAGARLRRHAAGVGRRGAQRELRQAPA